LYRKEIKDKNTYKLISSSFRFKCSSTFWGGGGGGGLVGWETFLYNDEVEAVREIPSIMASGIQSLTSLGLGSLLYLYNTIWITYYYQIDLINIKTSHNINY